GAFDDDLMSADAVHPVVDAVAALVEVALDLQGRELVRHDADTPALVVTLRLPVAVGQDFVGRVDLGALAERAKAAGAEGLLLLRRPRPLGSNRGDDDPAADDGVLAQLGHWQTPDLKGESS